MTGADFAVGVGVVPPPAPLFVVESCMCVRLVSHTARDIIRAHAYTDNVPLRLLAVLVGFMCTNRKCANSETSEQRGETSKPHTRCDHSASLAAQIVKPRNSYRRRVATIVPAVPVVRGGRSRLF